MTSSPHPPVTTPHPPGLPDCDFQNGLCDWNIDYELNATEFFYFEPTKGLFHPEGDTPTTDHEDSIDGEETNNKSYQDCCFRILPVGFSFPW